MENIKLYFQILAMNIKYFIYFYLQNNLRIFVIFTNYVNISTLNTNKNNDMHIYSDDFLS